MSPRVQLKIPASTSNLGSGFDTLGLALSMYHLVTLEKKRGPSVTVSLHDPALRQKAIEELVADTAKLFFKQAGLRPIPFHLDLQNEIPVARGFGFSGALRAGVVGGLNELMDSPLTTAQVMDLVALSEGHPDNATPAVLGGFTVAGRVGKELRVFRFRVPTQLIFVVLIPPVALSTKKARQVLPQKYSRADTAKSLNRSALITAALASGKIESLAGLFDDCFHQPYRESLVPQLQKVITAGTRAGALGGFLSGAGSGIICLTTKNASAVGRAMKEQFPGSWIKILRADNNGMRISHG